MTFIPGAPWLQLQPDGEHYDFFHLAWRQQERWTRADHRDFWASALKLWPTKRGKRESSVHISMWVWVFRRKGLGDGEIAERLGYSLESLRRGGALGMANDFAAYWDEHYRDRYCPPELPCPPPVVWPADIDDRPPLDGPFCSIAWDLLGPKDRQVREQVTALGVRAANWSASSRSGPPDLGSAEGDPILSPGDLAWYRELPQWCRTTLDSYCESPLEDRFAASYGHMAVRSDRQP